jgi:hypothetical protein
VLDRCHGRVKNAAALDGRGYRFDDFDDGDGRECAGAAGRQPRKREKGEEKAWDATHAGG